MQLVLETSARLLGLLSLLQARRFWTGAELARELEVTERTVRRDMDRLRSLGYPVNATSGVAGGYQLGTGAALPPLLLDDDEALAVALGLRTAAAGTVTGMEEVAVRALAKLEQVMPSRLRRRVQALHSAVVPLHRAGPQIAPELLSLLASACRNQERVEFRYADGQAQTSERDVEPHGLVHAGWRWYLVAWDLERADWRTFRVDRIAGQPRAGRRFVPRTVPYGDVAAYVSQSVASNVYTYQARVVLDAPLEVVAQRIPAMAGRLERIDAEHCLLETGGHSLAALGLYVAMLDVEFEVQEPPELVDHLSTLARRLARAARRSAARRGEARVAPSRRARTKKS